MFKTQHVNKYKGRVPGPVRTGFRESPWTCVECGVTQAHHALKCIRCGMPMIPASQALEKVHEAVTTIGDIIDESNLPSTCMIKIERELQLIREKIENLSKIEALFQAKSKAWDNFCVKPEVIENLQYAMEKMNSKVIEMDVKLLQSLKHVNNDDMAKSIKSSKLKLTSVATGQPLESITLTTRPERGTLSEMTFRGGSQKGHIATSIVKRVKDGEKQVKKEIADKIKNEIIIPDSGKLPSVSDRDIEAAKKTKIDTISTDEAIAKRKLKQKLRREAEKTRLAAIKKDQNLKTNKEAKEYLKQSKVKETIIAPLN